MAHLLTPSSQTLAEEKQTETEQDESDVDDPKRLLEMENDDKKWEMGVRSGIQIRA